MNTYIYKRFDQWLGQLIICDCGRELQIWLKDSNTFLKMEANKVIGIDVGGTHTDAVIVKHCTKEILSLAKSPTTKDVLSGVVQSLNLVLRNHSPAEVKAVIIGTTTFTNAVLQLSDELSKVNVIRLCGPASRGIPPFSGFPEGLKGKIKGECYMIDGGYECNKNLISTLELSQLDPIIETILQAWNEKSLSSINVVVSGIFSPICMDQEELAGDYISKKLTSAGAKDFTVTLSHKIGQIGLLERENAAILNASLKHLARKTVRAFRAALKNAGLHCALYLTQNDGTLISCAEAEEYPVLTFNSGSVNSLRGAVQMCPGIKNGLVVDVGGTSTDFAYIQNGEPRYVSAYSDIAEVRTNFRMPDTHSIALGGGSIVDFSDAKKVKIGPVSVGYRLAKEGISFGGKVLTTTDIALNKGFANIAGTDPTKVKVTPEEIVEFYKEVKVMIEKGIDMMKTSKEDIPMILVGGGSIIIPPTATFEGISEVIRPKNYNVANAIGAALAQISAEVHEIIDCKGDAAVVTEETIREVRAKGIEKVKKAATEKAVKNGAVLTSIELTVDEVGLAYVENQVRIKVRAVGNLDLANLKADAQDESDIEKLHTSSTENDALPPTVSIKEHKVPVFSEPWKNGEKEWILNENDIEAIGLGASVFGCGGGGSPYLGILQAKNMLSQGKTLKVIKPEALTEKDLTVISAGFGSPLVIIEKFIDIGTTSECVKTMCDYYGASRVSALAPIEIGGLNSLIPIATAGALGLPIVDCDFMGRAFPDLTMVTYYIYGKKIVPITIGDEKGNQVMVKNVMTKNGEQFALDILRHILMKMGWLAGIATLGFTKEEIISWGIRGTITKAWELGSELLRARAAKTDLFKVYKEVANAELLCTGKVIDVHRSMEKGYNEGYMEIAPLEGSTGPHIIVEFRNEYLCAFYKQDKEKRVMLVVVPDLLVVVDKDTYNPILAEDAKYGLRVAVLKLPAHELLKTEEALKLVGPKAFGIKTDQTEIDIGNYRV
eukprot:TRINITY_DN2695_c2_g1_i1.p1 TRINITY_DN2695_c2_g1~~TRINITY_DN2695_c2_g1_i1.p1  ORF type:complete len:1002 (+),score=85.78 TRINITY_DN2695_c2_g1_i1:55-3060(+)